MLEQFSESARRAMFFSRYEASRVGERIIGSEHLLLGILKEGDAVTTELWRSLGVSPDSIRAKYPTVEEWISSSAELPLSENAKKILAYAINEAEKRKDVEVDPCHLLLGILRVPESRAALLLAEHGVEYDVIWEVVRLLQYEVKRRAEIEERTPLILRQSHYEMLDRLAESMSLRDARRTNRQTLLLALVDALAASGMADRTFQSTEEFRMQLEAALRTRQPGA